MHTKDRGENHTQAESFVVLRVLALSKEMQTWTDTLWTCSVAFTVSSLTNTDRNCAVK